MDTGEMVYPVVALLCAGCRHYSAWHAGNSGACAYYADGKYCACEGFTVNHKL